MSDDVYAAARRFLDQFPLGFPEAPSGVEMKILKKLFAPDEARMLVHLTPFPEEADAIAGRTKDPPDRVAETLKRMAGKGLIFRTHRHGKVLYNAAPFMIGIYEYSVSRLDEELASLYTRYYEECYQAEMGASRVPGFKVLPVGESIRSDSVLLPYGRIEEEIRAARKIAVAPCICRKEKALLGEGCGKSLETCISLGVAAEYYIENGAGREISAEDALAIVHEADREGLVHASSNVRHLSNICNCCPCCCASLKGIVEKGHDRILYMNALYVARVNGEQCTACSACEDRCPVHAISVDDVARVDDSRCLGCGLCATGCPVDAVDVRLREEREEPYRRMTHLGRAILEGKEKHVGLSPAQEQSMELMRSLDRTLP